VAIVKPDLGAGPAAEARIYREANGASGHKSLLVLLLICGRGRLCLVAGAPRRSSTRLDRPRQPAAPGDES
jgi:hypothetical protein